MTYATKMKTHTLTRFLIEHVKILLFNLSWTHV